MEELTHFKGCIYDSENIFEAKKPRVAEISGFKRNIFGYEYDKSKPEYTILLVGASKCGKSTMIDFIANFFLGIESPNNKLVYVTKENKDKEDFCFYTFCSKDTVFNFIDTPSINDESGFIDAERKDIFNNFIRKIIQNDIDINALGFVIQNYFVRLPPVEENMIKFVTGLLGENTNTHIIPFITFADAYTPPVLEALRTFGINTEKHLVFNNVCLNYIKKMTRLIEIYWEDGLENVQKGIDDIMKLKPIELPYIPIGSLTTLLSDAGREAYLGLVANSLRELFSDNPQDLEWTVNILNRLGKWLDLPKNVLVNMEMTLRGTVEASSGSSYLERLKEEPLLEKDQLALVWEPVLFLVHGGCYNARVRELIKHVTYLLHGSTDLFELYEKSILNLTSEEEKDTENTVSIEMPEESNLKEENKVIELDSYDYIGMAFTTSYGFVTGWFTYASAALMSAFVDAKGRIECKHLPAPPLTSDDFEIIDMEECKHQNRKEPMVEVENTSTIDTERQPNEAIDEWELVKQNSLGV